MRKKDYQWCYHYWWESMSLTLFLPGLENYTKVENQSTLIHMHEYLETVQWKYGSGKQFYFSIQFLRTLFPHWVLFSFIFFGDSVFLNLIKLFPPFRCLLFLEASLHLYNRVCPSVSPSVGWSVRRLVTLSSKLMKSELLWTLNALSCTRTRKK